MDACHFVVKVLAFALGVLIYYKCIRPRIANS